MEGRVGWEAINGAPPTKSAPEPAAPTSDSNIATSDAPGDSAMRDEGEGTGETAFGSASGAPLVRVEGGGAEGGWARQRKVLKTVLAGGWYAPEYFFFFFFITVQ